MIFGVFRAVGVWSCAWDSVWLRQ